jgi:hypothetical protein
MFWLHNFGFCDLAALHDEAVSTFSGKLLFQIVNVLVIAVLRREENNYFYNRKKQNFLINNKLWFIVRIRFVSR